MRWRRRAPAADDERARVARRVAVVNTARNVAIVLALAALVAFLPGGGTAAAVIGGVLSTLILVSFVLIAGRFYREHRIDLDEPRRPLARAAVLLARGARARHGGPRFAVGDQRRHARMGGGVAAAAYSLYLVWRHSREY